MNKKQVDDYLLRIGLSQAPAHNAAGLAMLQQAHLENVPFENLDIVAGRLPLSLDEDALFDKIVTNRRGGICYELNLLFAGMLRALGFEVVLKGGRHPKYGDNMDHLFLLVRLPEEAFPFIVDVGFAYNFATPLRLIADEIQDDGRDRYQIQSTSDSEEGHFRIVRMAGLAGESNEEELYAFSPAEHVPADCHERCEWYCTSPQSRFTQGPLICIDGANCRRTLSAHHLITTTGATRTVENIVSPEHFEDVLHNLFGLTR